MANETMVIPIEQLGSMFPEDVEETLRDELSKLRKAHDPNYSKVAEALRWAPRRGVYKDCLVCSLTDKDVTDYYFKHFSYKKTAQEIIDYVNGRDVTRVLYDKSGNARQVYVYRDVFKDAVVEGSESDWQSYNARFDAERARRHKEWNERAKSNPKVAALLNAFR